jgi:uncharacterized protein
MRRRHFRWRIVSSAFVSASLATSISATVAAQTAPASAAHPAISVDFNVRIPMRDGVELSADIYSPSTSGRFPVIVVRNPYTKSAQWAQRGRWWAERGYVFVVQDVRGRGDSDGEFYPLVNEANDGTDTYNWAAKQRWSTGKVGGYGGSYAAWTQLYPVSAGNSSLSAMLPMAVPFRHSSPSNRDMARKHRWTHVSEPRFR